jgi:hypothetical protein
LEQKDLLKKWIQQYYDRLTYIAFTYVRDQSRAEDLVQETFMTNNGDLVIFTKVDESGWHLNKGEQLNIRFALDLKTNKQSDPAGEWMEIGYIKNGELITSFAKKAKDFSYTITANEAGEYYFYAENLCASSIIIPSGIIK